jgi:hypothetical protein
MGIVDNLIARAKRTPYYDLPGYMERYWLVPYSTRISREVDPMTDEQVRVLQSRVGDPTLHPDVRAEADANLVGITYDGTGPVRRRERPLVWLLQKLGIAARIHHILRSDAGRDPHDHPWPFVTIILRGGYCEMLYDEHGAVTSSTWHGPGSVLFRRANTWHRLIVPKGETCWTLFITGRKAQTWGFLVKGKKIGYREYLGS